MCDVRPHKQLHDSVRGSDLLLMMAEDLIMRPSAARPPSLIVFHEESR